MLVATRPLLPIKHLFASDASHIQRKFTHELVVKVVEEGDKETWIGGSYPRARYIRHSGNREKCVGGGSEREAGEILGSLT